MCFSYCHAANCVIRTEFSELHEVEKQENTTNERRSLAEKYVSSLIRKYIVRCYPFVLLMQTSKCNVLLNKNTLILVWFWVIYLLLTHVWINNKKSTAREKTNVRRITQTKKRCNHQTNWKKWKFKWENWCIDAMIRNLNEYSMATSATPSICRL